ncbi:MAG: ribbon-helix-helix domain-containing protein [Terricaulis sp.]
MPMTKGALQKRSVRIAGHRTSIALEAEFWDALTQIAVQRDTSLPRLLAEIDNARAKTEDGPSLASAVRVFLLQNRA